MFWSRDRSCLLKGTASLSFSKAHPVAPWVLLPPSFCCPQLRLSSMLPGPRVQLACCTKSIEEYKSVPANPELLFPQHPVFSPMGQPHGHG